MSAIEEDMVLHQSENMMLNFIGLHSVKDVKCFFLLEDNKVTVSDWGCTETMSEIEPLEST